MEIVNELLTTEYILNSVLTRCDDRALRKGLTIGFYKNMLADTLEEIAKNGQYNVITSDFPMPVNFRWQIPEDFFNLRELYAWNGSCCTPETSANIYWKRNFNNFPNGQGYTAMNKADQQSFDDPYFNNTPYEATWTGLTPNNTLFANIQNGYLMFSTACSGWSNFRVVYNSYGSPSGSMPNIPRAIRQAIEDYTCWKAFETLKVMYPKSQYGKAYDDVQYKLFNRQNGTWDDAVIWCKTNDSWMTSMRAIYNNVNIDV